MSIMNVKLHRILEFKSNVDSYFLLFLLLCVRKPNVRNGVTGGDSSRSYRRHENIFCKVSRQEKCYATLIVRYSLYFMVDSIVD